MEKSIRWFTRIGWVLAVGMVISHCQLARAGYSVNVGISTGSGTVTAMVISNTGVTNRAKTSFLKNPSAAINQQTNLTFNTTNALPSGADPRTFVQVQAFANSVTSVQSTNYSGDFADSENTDLLQFIIPRSACASSAVDIVPIQVGADFITFQYKAKLSDEGSAVLLQVIDSVTLQQKYVVLLVGPYDNTGPDNCEGTITVHGNLDQLNLLLDGTTGTLPFSISCPGDMVFDCATTPVYNPLAVVTGTTGPFTVTYDPPASQLVPGVSTTVTATAKDANGCTVSCQFKALRQPITFVGFDAPISGADASGGSCASPLRTFKLGNVVPVKFAMSCNGVLITGGVPPTIRIQSCTSGPNPPPPYLGVFEVFNNEWHFNIDSTVIGAAGKYIVTAVLPDASEHSVVLQYKR